MCSSGMQYRQVVCREGHETLLNVHCDETIRPLETQACHVWNNTICSHIRPLPTIQSTSSFIWDVKRFGEVNKKENNYFLNRINYFLNLVYFSVVQPVVLVVVYDKFTVLML